MNGFQKPELGIQSLLNSLSGAFPLRVAIGGPGQTLSETLSLVESGFIASQSEIPAVRGPILNNGERVKLPSGDEVTVTHSWTLLGVWNIDTNAILRETSGTDVGAQYKILAANIHPHGLHTDLKTSRLQ